MNVNVTISLDRCQPFSESCCRVILRMQHMDKVRSEHQVVSTSTEGMLESQDGFPSLIALLPFKIQFFTTKYVQRDNVFTSVQLLQPGRVHKLMQADLRIGFQTGEDNNSANLIARPMLASGRESRRSPHQRVRNWCGRTQSTRFSGVTLP